MPNPADAPIGADVPIRAAVPNRVAVLVRKLVANRTAVSIREARGSRAPQARPRPSGCRLHRTCQFGQVYPVSGAASSPIAASTCPQCDSGHVSWPIHPRTQRESPPAAIPDTLSLTGHQKCPKEQRAGRRGHTTDFGKIAGRIYERVPYRRGPTRLPRIVRNGLRARKGPLECPGMRVMDFAPERLPSSRTASRPPGTERGHQNLRNAPEAAICTNVATSRAQKHGGRARTPHEPARHEVQITNSGALEAPDSGAKSTTPLPGQPAARRLQPRRL